MLQDLKKIGSICFISRSAHYMLLNNGEIRIGGAELQQTILAEALAGKGINVYFITERIGEPKEILLHEQIALFPVLNFKKGNKYLRKIIYLPSQLWKTLKNVNADIYYCRNPDYLAGVTALFCKINAKPFVVAGANDWNFRKGGEENLSNFIDKLFCRLGIRIADIILVQNNRQQELLKRNYRREGILFYNVFPSRKLRQISHYVLWVSRIESYKRPELFLELARRLPGFNFIMVGGKSEDSLLEKQVEREAATLENVIYLGHQPLKKVEELFNESSVFVNTSIPGCEGFPNTFLQAWSRGIPVVSFFDIDNLISRNRSGMVVNSISEMVEAVQIFHDQGQNNQRIASEIKEFFDQQFSIQVQVAKFIKILNCI